MTAAMMVAMMLPSLAPTVWRYHRSLRAKGSARAGYRASLFSAGYGGVWAAFGLAMFAVNARLSPMEMVSRPDRASAWWTGVVILCAGALQCSRWKENQLLRCGGPYVTPPVGPARMMSALRTGARLGVACGLSCAAPMAVLLVAGLMDMRLMIVITAAITAERVAPPAARIARVTGAVAIVAGVVLCVRAIPESGTTDSSLHVATMRTP